MRNLNNKTKLNSFLCPICKEKAEQITKRIYKKQERKFFLCKKCELIFTPPKLKHKELIERYSMHNNYYEDLNYRKFLLELASPVFEIIKSEFKIKSIKEFDILKNKLQCLDYGCGPTKVMQKIFESQGFKMDSFDPIFYNIFNNIEENNKNKLMKYDIITCNEVIEHFEQPLIEFKKILKNLKPNGILAIGTSIWNEKTKLNSWTYMTDITHLTFYSLNTLKHIAKKLNLEIVFYNKRIVIYKLRY